MKYCKISDIKSSRVLALPSSGFILTDSRPASSLSRFASTGRARLGCPGNLLCRGSRGLWTGRPIGHRPYSARYVGSPAPAKPAKGRGRYLEPEEDRACLLPSGSAGSILGEATSTTGQLEPLKQTNKQANAHLGAGGFIPSENRIFF